MSVERSQISHRDIDLGAVALAVVLAGVAAWVGVVPTLENEEIMRRLTGQVADSQEQLKQLQGEFRTVQNSIRRAERELDQSYIELHGSDQLAVRQGELHALLTASGVTVEQLAVGSVSAGEQLDTITLRVTGTAAFPTTVSLMRTLREAFPDMAITAFQLVRGVRQVSDGTNASANTETVAMFVFDLEWYAARNGAGSS